MRWLHTQFALESLLSLLLFLSRSICSLTHPSSLPPHSSCTCPNEDHPGPFDSSSNTFRGRGAPEIDVLEAEHNKLNTQTGQVVSQSAQFAPFTHDYLYNNDTTDQFEIFDETISWPNTYK